MLKHIGLFVLRASLGVSIGWFAASMLHAQYLQAASVTLPAWFSPLGEQALALMSALILIVLPGPTLARIVLRSLAVVLIWSLPIFASEAGLLPGSDRFDSSLATAYSVLMLGLAGMLIFEEVADMVKRRRDPRNQAFSMATHGHLRSN